MEHAVNAELTATTLCWLRWTLFAGGLIDWSGALPFFFFPGWVQRTFQLPKQLDFWPKYAAVFLVVLGLVYFVSAIDPERSLANVGVAIVGRTLGAWFYFKWCRDTPGRQSLVFGMAALNLLLALVYGFLLWPARFQLLASLHLAVAP